MDNSYYLNKLTEKRNNLASTIVVLQAQGYSVNRCKTTRLILLSLLYDCFSNPNLFNSDRINNLKQMYNRLMLR